MIEKINDNMTSSVDKMMENLELSVKFRLEFLQQCEESPEFCSGLNNIFNKYIG